MEINKDDIKKRIIYRASYRGTKELDLLISSFVNMDDQKLSKLNKNYSEDDNPNLDKIYKKFYNFKPL